MGDKENKKKNMIFGVTSLLISAILQALFLCFWERNWIILAFTCVYAVVFLKYLKEESVVNWLLGRLSKKTLKILGTIVLFVGIAFLPQFLGQHLGIIIKFVSYIVSYICWMMGLLLIDISNEQ